LQDGIALNIKYLEPFTDSPVDKAATTARTLCTGRVLLAACGALGILQVAADIYIHCADLMPNGV